MVVSKCIHGFYSNMQDNCYTYMYVCTCMRYALHYSYGMMYDAVHQQLVATHKRKLTIVVLLYYS